MAQSPPPEEEEEEVMKQLHTFFEQSSTNDSQQKKLDDPDAMALVLVNRNEGDVVKQAITTTTDKQERRTPTNDDFLHWLDVFDKNDQVMQAFQAVANANVDWLRLPKEATDVRAGPPTSETKAQLDALAQGLSFLVASIAHEGRISRSLAWKLMGLSPLPSRAANGYNLYLKYRAAQLRAKNDGEPSMSLSLYWNPTDDGSR